LQALGKDFLFFKKKKAFAESLESWLSANVAGLGPAVGT